MKSSNISEPVTQPISTSEDLRSQFPFRSEDHEWKGIFCMSCGHTFDIPIKCGNRFCPTCSLARRNRVRQRLTSLFNRVPKLPYRTLKLVTLTIPNSQTVREGCDTLISSFRRLRQRKLWRSKVNGGVFVIEVTRGKNGYHVHLHAIVQGLFIDNKVLSREWAAVSPGRIVDVRPCWNINLVYYLTKYLTKVKGEASFVEVIGQGLKGRRLYQPFGSWFALDVPIEKKGTPCTKCGEDCWTIEDRLHFDEFGCTDDIPYRWKDTG